jgi:hypothetical protein
MIYATLTGLLPVSPALQGGVEGGFIKMTIIPYREARPLGRGASLAPEFGRVY